ncbi:MAG: zf-TFIIB domain-containing protein [Bdellovibrio sp.]|nr:zf-TFIIB domain-containing protein [Bdellovibrio sp.]
MPVNPSLKEEEYFHRLETELKKKRKAEEQIAVQEQERKRLQELHHMCCPKCGMHLMALDYKGIEIDECSSCKGIWLDANELEQIMAMEKGTLNRLLKIFKS